VDCGGELKIYILSPIAPVAHGSGIVRFMYTFLTKLLSFLLTIVAEFVCEVWKETEKMPRGANRSRIGLEASGGIRQLRGHLI